MNMTNSTPNAQRRTSKAQPSVELHIGELVLHDFAPGDRHVIGDAVERELSRLLSRQGIPSSLRSKNATDDIKGATFNVAHSAKPPVIGRQIAQAVYKGFRE
ncbi:MAG TPA: hypothetical protein VJ420_08665 [Candidatus Udaeobacter sp.]|nr:hypothetical protein [Candidatus Udaeobacter sp.]